MSECAQLILESCVKACNRVSGLLPACTLSITKTRFKFYHLASTSERLKAHDVLEGLANRYDWIEIEFEGRGFDEIPILQKVIILDSKALLDHQNISVIAKTVSQLCLALDDILVESPKWVQDIFSGYSDAWLQNKSFKGFSWKQFDGLRFGIKLITWAESYNDLKTDFRTASVKALGDSKSLEQNISIIAKVLRLKSSTYDDLSNEEVLANWGITRFAPLIRFAGDITVYFPSGEMNIENADPYVAVPLDNIESIKMKSDPAYILFIENLTSFERYTRTIKDNGLIVYTGGFPSHHWIRVVNTLKQHLSNVCEVYHWGDIDVGGYKILSYLERSLAMNIIPFRMLGNEGAHEELLIDIDDLISSLNCDGKNIAALKEKLIAQKAGNLYQYWVEQESLDPVSPIVI